MASSGNSDFGAFGGRLDHHLASVFLPSDPEIAPFMSQLYLMDQQNYLCYRPAGRHTILPIVGYTYVAFMPVEGASIQIEGAKYPLNQTNYFKRLFMVPTSLSISRLP